MKIVCDQNVVLGFEAFSTLGEVTILPGRAITAEHVRDADLLIVRSTTKVDAALLHNSRVRFCGSAVIGTDHLDIGYLRNRGIAWSAAPGCNAESVANYFTAALLHLNIPLAGRVLGIVGVGHVGSRIAAHAQALGLRILCSDPPRQAYPEDIEARHFVPLSQLLREADILTLHTPLTQDGAFPTHHLINAAALAQLKPGGILINAARGAVLDTPALLDALHSRQIAHAIIDCWEGEPDYTPELLHRAHLATPHIAGHSYEGKVNGTRQVYHAACRYLNVDPAYTFTLPPPPISHMTIDADERDDEDVLGELVHRVYNIIEDDQVMRAGCTPDPETRRQAFDYQRSNYPTRRQFDSTRVTLYNATEKLHQAVAALGFRLEHDPPVL